MGKQEKGGQKEKIGYQRSIQQLFRDLEYEPFAKAKKTFEEIDRYFESFGATSLARASQLVFATEDAMVHFSSEKDLDNWVDINACVMDVLHHLELLELHAEDFVKEPEIAAVFYNWIKILQEVARVLQQSVARRTIRSWGVIQDRSPFGLLERGREMRYQFFWSRILIAKPEHVFAK